MSTLPREFLDRLEQIVAAARYRDVLESFTLRPVTSFRVNTLVAPVEPVIASLRLEGVHPHAIEWSGDGFWVPPEERDALLSSVAADQRQIYVQGQSSMLPPLILAPEPGDRVLDLTAAPGSKTLQLAAMMQPDLMNGESELAAVEIVRGRFFKMKALLDAYGAGAVRTYLQNGERVWRYRPEHFDRVLLDAPCSTEGRFSTADPKTHAYWSPRKIREMAGKQRRLLFSGVNALKSGGVLVYSTCTFAPEENEVLIDWALGKFDGAVVVEPVRDILPLDAAPFKNVTAAPVDEWNGARLHEEIRNAVRILPGAHFEAFFVCRLRKIESTLRRSDDSANRRRRRAK